MHKMSKQIPIEISARHIHISQSDWEVLFGDGSALRSAKDISQPNQFVTPERVTLRGHKDEIKNVAVVGPARDATQVELSKTDAARLGIPETPILVSGSLKDSGGGITIIGTRGEVRLSHGVMIAQRHVHASPQDATRLGIAHGDRISLRTEGTRPITFHDVAVRAREGINSLAFHIDTDEANAAGLAMGDFAEIIK